MVGSIVSSKSWLKNNWWNDILMGWDNIYVYCVHQCVVHRNFEVYDHKYYKLMQISDYVWLLQFPCDHLPASISKSVIWIVMTRPCWVFSSYKHSNPPGYSIDG